MNKAPLTAILIFIFAFAAKSQSSIKQFDTILFNQQLEFANQLTEYEYFTEQAIGKFSKLEDVSGIEWFSFHQNNNWYTVGGNVNANKFNILHQIQFDSLYSISEYKGSFDSSMLNSSGFALAAANTQFQTVRDTCSIYFNSFVTINPDQSVSVRFLPAFQPSGQAIYGYEFEYIFDKSGRNFLKLNSHTNILTGVWIGQPRELWLNYRNTDKPTLGSIFFAQSFRDYFTRIRIDTRISTSTTTKDATGNYLWTHKMK